MTIAAGGFSVPLLAAAAAAASLWWVALGLLAVSRRPRRVEPPALAPDTTPDLVPEPPAIAGMVANGFAITAEAAPAVLLDLAARGLVALVEVQPGHTICRLHASAHPREETGPNALADYEQRVVEELERTSVDGVVSSEALSTGPENQSKQWHRCFEEEVVADARSRGLVVARWPRVITRGLSVGLGAVLVLVALAAQSGGDLAHDRPGLAIVALVTIVGIGLGGVVTARLVCSRTQLPTPSGVDAARRAAALAQHLRETASFGDRPPSDVNVWGRPLAYAAAFGVAPGAVALLPMGSEDDHHAWSRTGGRWRRVRVRYPRVWPPAWGKHPFLALALATFWGAVAAILGYGFATLAGVDRPDGVSQRTWDWVGRGALGMLIPIGAVLLWAIVVATRAAPDLTRRRVVSGGIVRDRRVRSWFASGDEPDYRYYLAVDDGAGPDVRAFRVRASLWSERVQGETVHLEITPRLGYVRSISADTAFSRCAGRGERFDEA